MTENTVVAPSRRGYCIASVPSLLSLLKVCQVCRGDIVRVETEWQGTALVLNYECHQCGDCKWESQAKVEGGGGHLFDGNLRLASAAHTCALPIPVRITEFLLKKRRERLLDHKNYSCRGSLISEE